LRARNEAYRLNHEQIGVEHLFLAIASISFPGRLAELRSRIPEGPDVIRIGLSPLPAVFAVMDQAAAMAASERRDQPNVYDLWEGIKACRQEDGVQWAQKLGFDLTQKQPTLA
jgi:hypothetical protein